MTDLDLMMNQIGRNAFRCCQTEAFSVTAIKQYLFTDV